MAGYLMNCLNATFIFVMDNRKQQYDRLNKLITVLHYFCFYAKWSATFNSVRLIWVPGHCGITGNGKVDSLATLGLNHLLISVYLSVDGLHMNRTNCGKCYLAADKLNASCTDVITHELAMLW